MYEAGYHLVLMNRGPASARDVEVEVRLTASDGRLLTLLDVEPGVLPLGVLDIDGRYPIPWLYEPFTPHARRFDAHLSWTDGAGRHQRRVALRRGQLPS